MQSVSPKILVDCSYLAGLQMSCRRKLGGNENIQTFNKSTIAMRSKPLPPVPSLTGCCRDVGVVALSSLLFLEANRRVPKLNDAWRRVCDGNGCDTVVTVPWLLENEMGGGRSTCCCCRCWNPWQPKGLGTHDHDVSSSSGKPFRIIIILVGLSSNSLDGLWFFVSLGSASPCCCILQHVCDKRRRWGIMDMCTIVVVTGVSRGNHPTKYYHLFLLLGPIWRVLRSKIIKLDEWRG